MPWIWTSIALTCSPRHAELHRLRRTVDGAVHGVRDALRRYLIEKGIGTIIPGFVPEPWGRIRDVLPHVGGADGERGLWALGAFVFTVLAKAAIPIELGLSRLRPQRARLDSGAAVSLDGPSTGC